MKVEYREVESLPEIPSYLTPSKSEGDGWLEMIFIDYDNGEYYPPMNVEYKVIWHLPNKKPV